MATTTNYGWTTPDDTALVKDGASAIRTLGSSVDTTTKNLNPETTLGDIAYRSSTANVNTRLGLGTAGQVLQVNSGANAPEWATPSSGGMTLISTTTLTGASITLSSIPQTYNNLQLIVRSFRPATDGAELRIRVNGDSAASRHEPAGVDVGDALTFNNTQWFLGRGQDNGSDNSLIALTVFDYTNAATWKIADSKAINNNSGTPTSFNFANRLLVYNQIAAISSFTIYPSSGNFTSGTALLYGVK